MPEAELKSSLASYAAELGADSLGVANVVEYSATVPNEQKPDYLVAGMQSIVVLTKHLLTGTMAMEDVASQSLGSHLALDQLEEVLYGLAEWLEDQGYAALPISCEYADMDLKYSGAGLLDLKWTAEHAGLGHVGLNLNFLSPEYGSRVLLGALLTDAVLEPDPALEDPLCPGLDCGRCAVLCPPKAIPLEAPRGASVNDYRDLDQRGCSQAATRLSIRSLYVVLQKLVHSEREIDPAEVLAQSYWHDFYIATNSKRGAFAACFECLYVCPVGSKDVRKVMRVPYRRQDLPPGSVTHIRGDQTHEVLFKGPPPERDPEYLRDRDFDALVGLGRPS